MGWKAMLKTMDLEELAYQMAHDLVIGDEQRAARLGLPSPYAAAGRRISMKDPDLLKKLAAAAGV